jgi:hypothetical protein
MGVAAGTRRPNPNANVNPNIATGKIIARFIALFSQSKTHANL